MKLERRTIIPYRTLTGVFSDLGIRVGPIGSDIVADGVVVGTGNTHVHSGILEEIWGNISKEQ